ncbi:MAG: hypothetical protein KAX20_04240 [Candidatus Omnitrophica bacterium]|nr:hypothetical protein [Candidatus Omnitrophota bacterium]
MSGARGSPDLLLLGEGAGDQFGYFLASAGDVNQDDSSEIVIGAWAWNNSRGKIYVYGSTPSGPQVPALSIYGLVVLIIFITASTIWFSKRGKRLSLAKKDS